MTDKKMLKFVRSFRHEILGGKRAATSMCAAICWPLATLLEANGVRNRVRDGIIMFKPYGEGNHYWIELEDGRVLDPTVNQFNRMMGLSLPPVYLGPPTEIHPPFPQTQNHSDPLK